MPIYRRMVELIKQSAVVHTDDTLLAVQDPKLDQTRTGQQENKACKLIDSDIEYEDGNVSKVGWLG